MLLCPLPVLRALLTLVPALLRFLRGRLALRSFVRGLRLGWLLLTLGVFQFASWLAKRSKGFPLANPVGLSILTLVLVSPETADAVNRTIDGRNNVFVCGTSVCRAVESCVTTDGHLKPNRGWTDKFIFPPYDFKITDHLITNFHMPESTLLMLASAFGGRDLVMKAYKKAIKEGYRFFSYGDATLIL